MTPNNRVPARGAARSGETTEIERKRERRGRNVSNKDEKERKEKGDAAVADAYAYLYARLVTRIYTHIYTRAWNATRRHNIDAGRRSSRSVRFLASVCRASWVPPCASTTIPIRVYGSSTSSLARVFSDPVAPSFSLARSSSPSETLFNYSPHRASNSSNRTLETSCRGACTNSVLANHGIAESYTPFQMNGFAIKLNWSIINYSPSLVFFRLREMNHISETTRVNEGFVISLASICARPPRAFPSQLRPLVYPSTGNNTTPTISASLARASERATSRPPLYARTNLSLDRPLA